MSKENLLNQIHDEALQILHKEVDPQFELSKSRSLEPEDRHTSRFYAYYGLLKLRVDLTFYFLGDRWEMRGYKVLADRQEGEEADYRLLQYTRMLRMLGYSELVDWASSPVLREGMQPIIDRLHQLRSTLFSMMVLD